MQLSVHVHGTVGGVSGRLRYAQCDRGVRVGVVAVSPATQHSSSSNACEAGGGAVGDVAGAGAGDIKLHCHECGWGDVAVCWCSVSFGRSRACCGRDDSQRNAGADAQLGGRTNSHRHTVRNGFHRAPMFGWVVRPKLVRIMVCMDRFNYVMPDWLSQLLDTKIEISSMGALLGTLSDVAEVCLAGGGMLRKRGADHEDISVEQLRGLTRYAANQMTFMGSRSSAEWAEAGVGPNEVVIHSEWLADVAEAARTLSYNVGQFDKFPVPVVFDTADAFRQHLDEQASFAARFHDHVVSEALAAEQAAGQSAPRVADSSS